MYLFETIEIYLIDFLQLSCSLSLLTSAYYIYHSLSSLLPVLWIKSKCACFLLLKSNGSSPQLDSFFFVLFFLRSDILVNLFSLFYGPNSTFICVNMKLLKEVSGAIVSHLRLLVHTATKKIKLYYLSWFMFITYFVNFTHLSKKKK